jgi:hypothetical protein
MHFFSSKKFNVYSIKKLYMSKLIGEGSMKKLHIFVHKLGIS